MSELRDAVLVGYVRTPFGTGGSEAGRLPGRSAPTTSRCSCCTRCCAARASHAGDVDGVILGAVEMMGEQAHPGTAIPFLAGFPDHVVGLSVERACTTAMMSVHIATMQIQCGLGDVFIAGGLDSMTHFRIPTIKDGMDMEDVIKEGGHMLAAMNPNPKLFERVNPIELNGGQGAERLADEYAITREDMDRWALRSHQRAIAARERLREEIVPDGRPRPRGTPGPRDGRSGPARRHDATRRSRRSRPSIDPTAGSPPPPPRARPTAPPCACSCRAPRPHGAASRRSRVSTPSRPAPARRPI